MSTRVAVVTGTRTETGAGGVVGAVGDERTTSARVPLGGRR
ncbi:hypothetical protein [Streptomyces sp. NP160]|nr:hypothetical protein [Streptomyces sp. NP160]